MAFSFGGISADSKKNVLNLRTTTKVVLIDKSSAKASYPFPVVVLVDELYGVDKLKIIELFLESQRITSYKIIAAINCIITKDQIKEDQKEGVIKFYRDNASDFWPEIPDNAVIVTSGPALYALTKADDIYPADCQDIIFGKTFFWFSNEKDFSKGNWIYPIESFRDIFAQGFFSGPVDSYVTKIARFQLKAVISRRDSLPPRRSKLTKVFCESFDQFWDKEGHQTGELMAVDLETSGFSFLSDKIGCVTISFDGRTGYYIPWDLVDKVKLNDLFKRNKMLGANLKFDLKFLWRAGLLDAHVDDDVNIIGHTIDEQRSNGLKALAYYYTPYGGYDIDLEEYKRRTSIDSYLDIPEAILREYAVMDAIITWQVFQAAMFHMRELDKKYPNERGFDWTLERYYRDIRMPAVRMYAKIEYRGVYVDPDKLSEKRQLIQNHINGLTEQLAEKLGVSKWFDFSSNTKLGKLLEELGWEDLGRTKAGGYQCSDFQLERWKANHPEVKLIQELRTSNVLLNTFLGDSAGSKGWSQYVVRHPDGSYRMHPNFQVMGTDSGRSRCSNPNMQNIPARGLFSEDIESCLTVPDKNEWYIVTLDGSSLQLRLCAADSRDPVLYKLFCTGGRKVDVHSKTTFGVLIKGKYWKTEEITVEQNGRVYKFLGGQIVRTKNRGDIFAKDLTEADELTNDA